jgi:predicted HAD superfamily hydrolase
MDKVAEIAFMCTSRAVSFGALAIGCIMFSFSFDPVVAMRAGAILTLAMSAILLVKAATVTRQKVSHTEAWIYLDKESRRMDEAAKDAFRRILSLCYLKFAQGTLYVACAMFVLSMLLWLAGIRSTYG